MIMGGKLPLKGQSAKSSDADRAHVYRLSGDENGFFDNDFFLFTNADNKHLNIIYGRRDGLYGLIEA
jgi:hypothetical protein